MWGLFSGLIVYENGIIMMQAFQALPDSDKRLKDMLLQAYTLLGSSKQKSKEDFDEKI